MDRIPVDQVGSHMSSILPFVATTGLEYVDVTRSSATVRLADDPALRNHVGGPHAAMMFAAAETAAGAVAFAEFSDLFDRILLVPFSVTVDFVKVALGPLTARAHLEPEQARAAREVLAAGTRPEFAISAEITNEAGEVTGRFTSSWTMRLVRASGPGAA